MKTIPMRTLPPKNVTTTCPATLQRGLTLIELMVSLVISTAILAGLVQIFTLNRATYQSDEGLARLQENARFAMEFLGRDLRNVGNMGCFSSPKKAQDKNDKVTNFVAGPTYALYNQNVSVLYDTTQLLRGFDATAVSSGATYGMPALYPPTLASSSYPSMTAQLTPAAFVAGSDLLIVRSMDQDSYRLVAPFNDVNAVHIKAPNNIDVGQIVIFSNCKKAAIFQVTAKTAGTGSSALSHDTSGTPGNTCATWGSSLSCRNPLDKNEMLEGTELGMLRTNVYFVGVGTSGGPALFRNNYSSGSLVSEELVEGVENLQFLYSDGTRYMQAKDVTNWTGIKSVRVGMLVATSNVVVAGNTDGATESELDTNQYLMQDITFQPVPDRRRRRSFETTIQVRNKL